nr:MAG TPA: hypothetical protein [Bacteriophage sp.]
MTSCLSIFSSPRRLNSTVFFVPFILLILFNCY